MLSLRVQAAVQAAEVEVLVSAVELALALASEQDWAAALPVQASDQESVPEWVRVCWAAEYFPRLAPRHSLDHSNSRSTTPQALAPRARDDCALRSLPGRRGNALNASDVKPQGMREVPSLMQQVMG